jgi:hypothetical protein
VPDIPIDVFFDGSHPLCIIELVKGTSIAHDREVMKEEIVEHGSPPGVPRWVKAFAIVVGIVVLLVVAAMFVIGGRHGPGRHLHGADTALAQVTRSFVGE